MTEKQPLSWSGDLAGKADEDAMKCRVNTQNDIYSILYTEVTAYFGPQTVTLDTVRIVILELYQNVLLALFVAAESYLLLYMWLSNEDRKKLNHE